MVSLRPLLFANLLIFLLFVTAGFAAYDKGGFDSLLPEATIADSTSTKVVNDSQAPLFADETSDVDLSSAEQNGQLAMIENSSQSDASGRVVRNAIQAIPEAEVDEAAAARAVKSYEALAAVARIAENRAFSDSGGTPPDLALTSQLLSEKAAESRAALKRAEADAVRRKELAAANRDAEAAARRSAEEKRATDKSEKAAKDESLARAVPATKTIPEEAAPASTTAPELAKTTASESIVKPKATTGTLVIRSNVNGDKATIDGRSYGSTAVTRSLKPGRYQVAVTKNGFDGFATTAQVSAGETTIVRALLSELTGVEYADGKWRNGVRSGEGSYSGSDGTRYNGNFEAGEFEGYGRLEKPDGTRYEGDFLNGEFHGSGVLDLAGGGQYTGAFRNGKYDGQGTLTTASGDIYTGTWSGSRLNGQGSYTSKGGNLYVGNFVNGEFHGEGTMTYSDGSHYEGTFANGNYQGKGALTFASGKRYVGQFLDGQFHGLGEFMNPNGSRISGNFKFGEPFGQATLTTAQGEVFTARTSEPGICYREKSYRATACPQLEGW